MDERKVDYEDVTFIYPDSSSWKLEKKIHVWKFPMLPADESLLSKSEIAITRRFRFEADRSRFATARRALRFLVSKYLSADPQSIDIVALKGEKPFISYPVTQIRFNISHSGEWIMIGLSNEELGIDIEKINSSFDYSILLDEHFTNAERHFIRNSENPQKAFYFLWTRKEALVKASGRGLQENLKTISVLEGQEFKDLNSRTWQIGTFILHEDYPVSFAYCSFPEEICYFDGSQLLS